MAIVRLWEFMYIFAGNSMPPQYVRSSSSFWSQMSSTLLAVFGTASQIRSDWMAQSTDCRALEEELYEAVQNVGLFHVRELGDLSTLYEDLSYDSSAEKSEEEYRLIALIADMAGWIMARAEYYATLSGYRDQAVEEGLLGPVTSSSSYASRYNEIPGDNGTLENFYDDDDHATSTDRRIQSAETDMATKMARLREIIAGYPTFVGDFAREFEERYGVYERIKI